MVASPLTVNSVVVEAHRLCRPVTFNANKREIVPVTLPERVARMYLDMRGEWNLPPLTGISTAPLLSNSGTIRTAIRYDPASGLGAPNYDDMYLLAPTAGSYTINGNFTIMNVVCVR
jgi:hypothetical protein